MPPSTTPISATSTPLVRLLSTGPERVSLENGLLRFGDARATPVGAIDSIHTHRSWFWTRLTVRQADGAEAGPHEFDGFAAGHSSLGSLLF